jgi:two-component system, NtrC family, sensor kinase
VRLSRKVFLLLLLCALPPAALSGWVSVRVGGRAIETRVLDFEERAAAQAAEGVERSLHDAAADLRRICDYIPFERFPQDELAQALRIPYQQLGWATAVALLDESGRPLATPARRGAGERSPGDREPLDLTDLEIFGAHVPLRAALDRAEAISAPYLSASGAPRLAYARSFAVAAGRRRWVLAVEASLAGIQAKLATLVPGRSGAAYLVDAHGVLVTHPRADWLRARRSTLRQPVVGRGLVAGTVVSGRYRDLGTREVIGAFAPVPAIGGGVVLEQPGAEAFAAIGQLRAVALLWTLVGLALAGFGAVILARGVTAPVRELAEAARAVERGDYDRRLAVRTRDELGDLAEAFNRMSAEVRQKQEEVTAWNRELAARVEERTRELREARDQVVRSEKLAATAELAAGVAHELNNPLTGILGLGQVLLQSCTNGVRQDLEEIVNQAGRMRDIIRNFMRFARPSSGTGRQPLCLNRVVEDAVLIHREKIDKRHIEVAMDCAPALLDVDGSPSDLLLAVMHLVSNAVHAMPRGGTLALTTRVVDHAAVKVVVRDSGVGIEPERLSRIFEPFYTDRSVGASRAGGGLGLSVAHRIIEEHGGRIVVDSTPGAGTSFTLFFPGIRKELHLR